MSGFKRFINLIEVDHPEGLSHTQVFLSVRPINWSMGQCRDGLTSPPAPFPGM